MAVISGFWTISFESLKKYCIKKETFLGKHEAGITILSLQYQLCKSSYSAIVFWLRKGVASHCRSPSVLWVPQPRSTTWLPHNISVISCNLMYSRKREGCVWLLIRFFCEIKNAIDFCMTLGKMFCVSLSHASTCAWFRIHAFYVSGS